MAKPTQQQRRDQKSVAEPLGAGKCTRGPQERADTADEFGTFGTSARRAQQLRRCLETKPNWDRTL